jgi:hypothetical protein
MAVRHGATGFVKDSREQARNSRNPPAALP